MRTKPIRVSRETTVRGLAQSIRFAVENDELLQVSAIGERANYTAIKAIASLSAMMDRKFVCRVEWHVTEGRNAILYTLE